MKFEITMLRCESRYYPLAMWECRMDLSTIVE